MSVPADYTKTVSTNEAKTEYVIAIPMLCREQRSNSQKVWNDSNDGTEKHP